MGSLTLLLLLPLQGSHSGLTMSVFCVVSKSCDLSLSFLLPKPAVVFSQKVVRIKYK